MPRVLIAPLDWGLGHATRCIPVIREFQRQGCPVALAGSGDSLTLLQKEFPALPSFLLPGYRPRYPLHGSMVWAMARQLPGFIKVISDEHLAVERIIDREGFGIVISDNRYGCWSSRVPSVFITHQSNILMPNRFGWLQRPVRVLSEKLLNRFHVCWVPDAPGEMSLAGDLVSNVGTHKNVRFIGGLSRFERNPAAKRNIDIAVIFSGPEPQRTQMEKVVMPQLERSGLTYRAVRGLPASQSTPPNACVQNFLLSDGLQECIESAGIVIARSGYSTVMDMQRLGKKAIFIPTPGQTEQEYLARRLRDRGIAFFVSQHEFDLQHALRAAREYSGFEPLSNTRRLQQAVALLLEVNHNGDIKLDNFKGTQS